MSANKPVHFRRTLIAAALLCATAGAAVAETGNPRVNQLGYIPAGPKIAVYATDSNAPLDWELRRGSTPLARGQTIPFGHDGASGENLHHIDLSEFDEPGENLTLHVGRDQSYPFAVDENIFSGVLYDSLKYFYHNRSGIPIETRFTGGGNSSYAADSRWARPAGHLNQGANRGDENVQCWSGTCNYSLNVTKGWYDAGDHGKYVVNGGISVWKLLNMYERALHVGGNAAAFADGTLNIPESGNGVPDILDEVRWQMDFMLSMQVPEGQPKAGMAHHKVHDIGWTGLPLAPHEDGNERALVPPSTTATLNLAATGAQCARLWKDIDSAYANRCLTAAQTAWEAARRNPNDLYHGGYDDGGGGYGDGNAADEFYWAAAELYITTGDERYLQTINNYQVNRIDFGWPDTELPGLMSLAVVPTAHTTSLRANAQRKIAEIADHHVNTINSVGYLVPTSQHEYYWGSNNVMANKLFLVGLAYDFTEDHRYGEAFGKAIDYLFGRNTLSFSFVSGHGENSLKQPHHRFWAGALNGNYPWLPPGALAGGPNTGLEDEVSQAALGGCGARPATCYIDRIDAWSTNEITINWNGALAWVLAFYNDYAGAAEGGPVTPPPDTETPPDDEAPVDPPPPTTGGPVQCEYVVSNEWNVGFTAAVRIINNGSEPVSDWSLEWRYDDGTEITNIWNATLSGNDPYRATDVGWNATVQPGQTMEFGFQANKGNGPAQVPTVSGAVCQ